MKVSRHGRPPGLAELRFAERAEELRKFDRKSLFEYIYKTNLWGADTSRSGLGSEVEATQEILNYLPKLLTKHQINSMLDIPCGDFNWLAKVNLPLSNYVGADIVEPLIKDLQKKFSNKPNYQFLKLDLISDPLPTVDLVFCRDCLVHFSYEWIAESIGNLKKSGSRYFMATTFTELKENTNIQNGDWRPLNLEKTPFNFPTPIDVINEKCSEVNGAYQDKSLALWKVESLPTGDTTLRDKNRFVY